MAANHVVDLSGGPVLLSFSLSTGCFAIATTFVRFYVRGKLSKTFVADDYAGGVATVVALIGTIFGIIESSSMDASRALEFDVLGQPWYLMSVTLSKISICLFFMSFLGRARQWRILLGVLIFVMAAVNLAFALTFNLQCRPLEKMWDPDVVGECQDPNVQLNFGYFQGAFSVFTWFFLALFPILLARDLQREGNPRWAFYVTAGLSFASGIIAIVRTAETSQTPSVTVYTIHHFLTSLMANLEQNVGLMAANVLTLGPLFSRQRLQARDPYASAASTSSRRSKKSGRTPSRAGSTRPITRASSRASSRREGAGSRASNRSANGAAASAPRNRSQDLIIQGPRRKSQDDGTDHAGFIPDDSDYDEYDLGNGRNRDSEYDYEDVDLEAWPKGIIKTVSVEVVEEVNPDHVPGATGSGNGNVNGNASGAGGAVGLGRRTSLIVPSRSGVGLEERVSGASGVEQDWETMLRNGPPR